MRFCGACRPVEEARGDVIYPRCHKRGFSPDALPLTDVLKPAFASPEHPETGRRRAYNPDGTPSDSRMQTGSRFVLPLFTPAYSTASPGAASAWLRISYAMPLLTVNNSDR